MCFHSAVPGIIQFLDATLAGPVGHPQVQGLGIHNFSGEGVCQVSPISLSFAISWLCQTILKENMFFLQAIQSRLPLVHREELIITKQLGKLGFKVGLTKDSNSRTSTSQTLLPHPPFFLSPEPPCFSQRAVFEKTPPIPRSPPTSPKA